MKRIFSRGLLLWHDERHTVDRPRQNESRKEFVNSFIDMWLVLAKRLELVSVGGTVPKPAIYSSSSIKSVFDQELRCCAQIAIMRNKVLVILNLSCSRKGF